MAKREWGAKHTCTGCGVKFYDLHRKPIKCPKCGIEIEVAIVRPNRRRPPAPPPPANDDQVVVGAVEEAADDGDDVIDDIDDGTDDLVEGIDKGEPAQAES